MEPKNTPAIPKQLSLRFPSTMKQECRYCDDISSQITIIDGRHICSTCLPLYLEAE